MFLFPPSMWNGGIFYEHTHRLLGAAVGVLAIAMVVWVWRVEKRRWIFWFAVTTLLAICVQGVIGGQRVTMVNHWPGIATPLAVVHGITGQIILSMTLVIAMATGRWWIEHTTGREAHRPWVSRGLTVLTIAFLGVLLIQLAIGATMRHHGAALAIPDFPTSYGGVIPPLTDEGVRKAMDQIPYDQHTSHDYYTAAHVGVHFAHRVWALAVVLVAGVLIARVSLAFPAETALRRPLLLLMALLIVQIALGVLVIWTGRHPEIATAHQATGAVVLGAAVLIAIRVQLLSRWSVPTVSAEAREAPSGGGGILLEGAGA
jgi:cytochrome c oxidase assembly protein subunit 15